MEDISMYGVKDADGVLVFVDVSDRALELCREFVYEEQDDTLRVVWLKATIEEEEECP